MQWLGVLSKGYYVSPSWNHRPLAIERKWRIMDQLPGMDQFFTVGEVWAVRVAWGPGEIVAGVGFTGSFEGRSPQVAVKLN
jgi:hypothetical protein